MSTPTIDDTKKEEIKDDNSTAITAEKSKTETNDTSAGDSTFAATSSAAPDATTYDSSAYYDPNQYYYGYDYNGATATTGANGGNSTAEGYIYDSASQQYYYDPNYYSQYYASTSGTNQNYNGQTQQHQQRQQGSKAKFPTARYSSSYYYHQQQQQQPQDTGSYNGYNSTTAGATGGYNNNGYYDYNDPTVSAGVTGITPTATTATTAIGVSGGLDIMGGSADPNKPVIQMSTSGYTGPKSETDAAEDQQKKKKKKPIVRAAAGETWEDPTLQEWDDNDFRLFAGDLGNEVTDEILFKAFSKYPSLQRTRVVRDKRSAKSKGYGFISFKDPNDFVKAWREMNGKYVGNRPIKLRKSAWKDRNLDVKTKKERERFGPYPKVK